MLLTLSNITIEGVIRLILIGVKDIIERTWKMFSDDCLNFFGTSNWRITWQRERTDTSVDQSSNSW